MLAVADFARLEVRLLYVAKFGWQLFVRFVDCGKDGEEMKAVYFPELLSFVFFFLSKLVSAVQDRLVHCEAEAALFIILES